MIRCDQCQTKEIKKYITYFLSALSGANSGHKRFSFDPFQTTVTVSMLKFTMKKCPSTTNSKKSESLFRACVHMFGISRFPEPLTRTTFVGTGTHGVINSCWKYSSGFLSPCFKLVPCWTTNHTQCFHFPTKSPK